jgi:hypothetical protein
MHSVRIVVIANRSASDVSFLTDRSSVAGIGSSSSFR